MATGKISFDEGTDVNAATNTISEDAVTKHINRTVLNKSDGTELGTSSAPVEVNLRSSTVGVATAAKQPALGTAGSASTDVITIQGIASGTVVPISVATIPSHAVTNAGTFAVQATEADGANVVLGSKADAKSTATDTTAITMMQVLKQISASVQAPPSQAVTNAGTFAVQSASAGDVAHDAADSGNPVKVGGKATNVEPSAVSATGDRANFITDMVGKQITLPYSNPENNVSGAITSAMTGTTSTSLVAAPASGLRNYITQITVSNAHATVGTDIIIQDGSGGTTLYTIPAAAVYGGATLTFPVALRQPTTATAIYCANVTTGASTKVSASGFKGV